MPLDTESIAITGMSGRFPKCENVEELQEALYSGKDLVSDNHNRWSYESLDTSPRLGIINDFEYFDAAFFGINPKEANVNDPRLRKILEVTYEAVVDAGLNPSELRGKKVGVFLGISPNDISDLSYKGGILGRSAAIMANIVSYCFDFKGPSLAVNTACSSALFAFNHAVESIVCGRCHIAIVGAVQHQVDPAESIELLKFGVLHREGVCRPFDANRKGYVKSEAIAAIVLQRVETSKRIYATIAGVGTNVEGFKRDGMAHPSHEMQYAMFEDVHRQFDIDPLEVGYVETHCTGTIVGDVEEVQAIDDFYTKGRKTPLLIGSVKGNLGHTETTSGIVSLIKAIFAIREGIIPGNLHFKTPDPEMRGICEGRIKVIDKNMPLPNGLIAVNSFGFGGANAMVLLRPYTQKKQTLNNLPYRLIHVSGRTEEGIELMLKTIIDNKNDQQFLSLFDNIYKRSIDNHNHRGYAVLSKETHYHINQCSSKRRPVWYVYAGFGSQWPGMAKDMMQIDIFRNTIKKCADVVKPYGIDLEDVVVNGTEETFNNVEKAFTAITAISVALTDVLTAMNIKPDGIIGHSLGEAACAYADGLVTAEQATLVAYARGHSTMVSDLIAGAMVAVGLSNEECAKILPEGIYIACENADDNVTISGPRQAIADFVKQLNARGIFNRIINNANYALHCPHLKPAGQKMYEIAKKAIPDRKLRSKRWLSSAFRESEWNTDMARHNSAEYHFHNYLNKVHFNQVLKYIPKDALVIEVAPRGLLRGILKRALDPNVAVISLMKPDVNNVDFFLSSIGQYYNSGGQVNLQKFYKSLDFPVGINTPTIASLVKWDHRVKWYGLKYNPASAFGSLVDIDMNEKENEYLEGHVADGRVILPAAGYIFLVWEAFAKMLATTPAKLPVVFENVKTLRPILLLKNETTTIIINIFRSTGYFEICLQNDEQNVLSSGKILAAEEAEKEFLDSPALLRTNQYKLKISRDEFYNCMRLRGFDYDGVFMGVQQCDIDGKSAVLKWNNNWIAFMDAMVQFVLSNEATGHSLPTIFDKIVINPMEHLKYVGPNSNMILQYDKDLKSARCGGIEIRNILVTNVKRRTVDIPPTLKKYTFVPNDDNEVVTDPFQHAVDVATQIVIENSTENLNVHVAEIGSDSAIQILKSLIDRVNLKKMIFSQIKSIDDDNSKHFDLLICPEESTIKNVKDYTNFARFVFVKTQNIEAEDDEIIYKHVTKLGSYVLLRRRKQIPENYTIVVANNYNYNWVKDLKLAVKKYRSAKSRIYLINEDFNSGIIGLFNTIRLEQYCPNLRVFFMRSYEKIETFSLESNFYLEQIEKDLTVNIYQDGSWGTYRRLPLSPFLPTLMSDACLLKDNKGVKWVEKSPFINHNNIFVHFASINKWDSLIISDRAGLDADQDEFLGLEYSGVDKNGNNVMGILPRGALSTTVQAHSQLTWNFSDKFSFEEAATIPLAYTLTHYALFTQVHLSPKNSILVHNSANDLSLAAITLSLNKGCTVYVAANSSQQIELKDMFPNLNDTNIILWSTESQFYKTLMKKTNGKGVDVIFNCNSIELLKLSKKYISKNGHFVEVANNPIEFLVADNVMEKGCSFHNVNISDIFTENEDTLHAIAADINKYLKEGTICPFRYAVFDREDIEHAVKHLEEKTEKCLIKIKEKRKFFSKSDSRILAYPRTYLDPLKSYIIIGGLGGFGFQLAKWLVERGATRIVLNSRFDIRSGYHASCLQKWNNQGLIVVTNTSDTSTLDGAESLINFATNLAPVGGIFNTALHVQDEFMSDVTPTDFMAVAPSKIFSAQNMDILSRKLCKNLDYFIMFSSIASSIGNPIQGNYAFVNSAVERLCETRKAEGLPGLAIEWGPLADVGILVRMKLSVQYLETQRQKLSSLLEVLDQFLQQKEPVVSSCVYGSEEDEISENKTLVEMVANLFGIKNVDEIEDSTTLLQLGMDSLLGFEVKHILSKESGVEVNINDIRNMTFEKIREISV